MALSPEVASRLSLPIEEVDETDPGSALPIPEDLMPYLEIADMAWRRGDTKAANLAIKTIMVRLVETDPDFEAALRELINQEQLQVQLEPYQKQLEKLIARGALIGIEKTNSNSAGEKTGDKYLELFS